jgi:4-hydroxybenzoate polyprenyltransferase
MRVDKPIGWLLLFWPTMWALWLAASGLPSTKLLLIFALGVFLTRSAGCVINDYADRWLDGSVLRTANRPLVRRAVSGRFALALATGLLALAFTLVCFTNAATIWLSVAALAVTILYPYCKRFTYYPQVILGVAFSFGIPMAFCATLGHTNALSWLLFCANILWTCAYDTYYAMVDREDDLRVGAKSTAILFGDLDRPIILFLQAGFLASMVLLGQRSGLTWPYFFSLIIAAAIFAAQFRMTSRREPYSCFKAFRANHWIGVAIWFGIAIACLQKNA